MRNPRLQITTPLDIRSVEVKPQKKIKDLGVIINSELHFKNHIKKILIKNVKMIFTLKWIHTLISVVVCQLFNTIVAPNNDYITSV